MGSSISYTRRRTSPYQLLMIKSDLSPPNNKCSEIGEFAYRRSVSSEKKGMETWNRLLKSYNSSNPIEELLKDSKNCRILNSYMREGIPVRWRWETWKSYINLSVITERNYIAIPLNKQMVESVIKKDVDRTFPEHKYFDKDYFGYIGQFALLRVLGKFATAYSEIGYCQGMNFIVGFLLIVSGGKEVESFCMLEAVIYHFKIQDFFTEDMLELKKNLSEFDYLFHKQHKQLHSHFRVNDIYEDMWVLKWFITLFTVVLPIRVVLNVWDILMVDGISILPYVALAILKHYEAQLLIKEGAEILQFFNSLPLKEIDPQILLQPLTLRPRKSKIRADGKIFPFLHPKSSSTSEDFSFSATLEPPSPSITVKHCEIIEDPDLLPVMKPQHIQKQYSKISYKNSLIFDEPFESSSRIDCKTEDTFDAHVILHDLITEDFE